jgi:hypothetical protein
MRDKLFFTRKALLLAMEPGGKHEEKPKRRGVFVLENPKPNHDFTQWKGQEIHV